MEFWRRTGQNFSINDDVKQAVNNLLFAAATVLEAEVQGKKDAQVAESIRIVQRSILGDETVRWHDVRLQTRAGAYDLEVSIHDETVGEPSCVLGLEFTYTPE